MPIDWIDKLRHLLQTLAFCLAVAAIQYAFRPEQPYGVPLAYSLCIGVLCWAFIDIGRHLLASSAGTGWPAGWRGMALPACGIALGFVLGSLLADAWTGHSTWSGAHLRTSIGITLLAGTAATYWFHTRGKSAWLQARMADAQGRAAEARLKLLETQLEPHMLFNTLANLRVLIASDPARAQAMLDHLIAYLRATLGASRSALHPLSEEFARLADYLALIAVRMGPRLQYRLDLPDALRDVPVPPLLLQPLAENAIRHGLEPQVAGGSVAVQARLLKDGARLQLSVHDTGAGPGAEAGNDGTRFGLQQVRERLATLYGSAATLELIASSAGGTSAIVTFPLKHATDRPDRRG
ncbi:sensor histidine kinase [Alicycliphilus denitrificans]|uniref:Signal transduction histidine kinase, LytS n=1 Tax=Alicycliphilus denitrificans (strain DSM 14773 / CIP 107495 / K601) TaxID=596154 RepID=F4GDW6_ALIDK|nr:histidine kinase [Alicycliphilus denitrificans]AEB83783.1 signal transduction histidine kinase, LytS [Alicycliphilus denitrificans K601]